MHLSDVFDSLCPSAQRRYDHATVRGLENQGDEEGWMYVLETYGYHTVRVAPADVSAPFKVRGNCFL